MRFSPILPLILVFLATTASSLAAINPEEYKRAAPDALLLREIARVVATEPKKKSKVRRVTLVAEVLEVRTPSRARARVGDTIVIDYTVDIAALTKARDKFRALPPRPGPQFLHEPDPPQVNADREFVAYLAPAATRLANVKRYAGAKVDFSTEHFSGPIFVPVAAQYSFEIPQPSSDQ